MVWIIPNEVVWLETKAGQGMLTTYYFNYGPRMMAGLETNNSIVSWSGKHGDWIHTSGKPAAGNLPLPLTHSNTEEGGLLVLLHHSGVLQTNTPKVLPPTRASLIYRSGFVRI